MTQFVPTDPPGDDVREKPTEVSAKEPVKAGDITKRVPIAIRLSGLIFVIHVMGAVFPQLLNTLVFMPARAGDPLYAHTFLTYALIPGSLLEWIRSTILFVLCGLVVEQHLGSRYVVAVIIGAALMGSVLCLVLNLANMYIGTGLPGAGYMGAYLATWFKHREQHGRWARVGVAAIVVLILMMLLSGVSVQVSVALTGIASAVAVFLTTRSASPVVETHNS